MEINNKEEKLETLQSTSQSQQTVTQLPGMSASVEEVAQWFKSSEFQLLAEYFVGVNGLGLFSLSKEDLLEVIPIKLKILAISLYNKLHPKAQVPLNQYSPQGKGQKRNLPSEEKESKHQKLISTPVGPAAPCDKAGQFVDLSHLCASGFVGNIDKWRFYVRTESAQLWTKLNGTQNLLLIGPPRTGKSSLVWAWCLWSAAQGTSVCWIHKDRFGSMSVVEFCNKSFTTSIANKKQIDDVILNTSASILVIDGLTRDSKILTSSASFWWKTGPTTRRFIFISSDQIYYGVEDYASMNMVKITSSGWTENEYKAACKDPTFFTSIKANLDADPTVSTPDEQISAKFFIAGASVNWMFNFNSERAIKDIKENISRISNMNEILTGLQGNRGILAVNHLVSTVKGEIILVSEFVARELAKKCELSFVSSAAKHAVRLNNKSFDGWIFQMDFLAQLTMALKSGSFLQFTNSAEKWIASNILEFYKEDDLTISQQKPTDNSWLIPTKVNQDCYDALQLLPGNILQVVQLTVAQTRSLKLRFVITILKVLKNMGIKIAGLDVVVVVPSRNESSFRIGPVESDKHKDITDLGWTVSKLRILGFKRS